MDTRYPPLEVNSQFDSILQLRDACKQHALRENFEFSTVKSNKSRYTIKCKSSDSCPWRLHASLTLSESDTSKLVEIKTMNASHSCFGQQNAAHKHASSTFIVATIQSRLQEHASYHPADVVNDMRREHGLQIGYWTAWRAKEAAFANINGSHESAFSQLPQYCEDIIRSNPGSTAIVERTPDDCFLRMFVSYAASGKGFAYCHAVLGLDGSHLKSRYQGVLLAATAVDANGSLFPVSYAVVSAENDDNWSWFIDNLHNVIQMHAPTCLAPRMLAFISDRQKGLLEAVEKVFPGSPHGYCLRHLYENLHKLFKHKDLRSLLWEAARAVSAEAFNEAIEKMHGLSPPAVDWLLSHSDPAHWCEFYFPRRRYGHLTSNIAESLNAWLLEAREKPVLAMFEQMRHQSMQWFDKRRHIDTNTEGLLVSTAAKAIQSTLNLRARRYRIISADDNVYEVFSLETSRNYVVKVSDRTCTCWSWQSTGLPCGHAIAVSLNRKENPQALAAPFYTLMAYRETYSNAIYPPNLDAADNTQSYIPSGESSEDTDSMDLLPPSTHRPTGRPKKRRIRGAAEREGRDKRAFRCSRCKQAGHSVRRCKQPI